MRRKDGRDLFGSDRTDPPSVHRRSIRAISLAIGTALFCSPAVSQGILGGDVSTSANFTLTHGLTFRAENRDPSLNSINGDNGDLNYEKRRLVSNTSNLTAEFEINSGDFGLFARLNGFMDFETQNGSRERTPLSEDALNVAGRDFRILDLYASAFFEPGGVPLDIRVGNQVLNWGESTFIPNGINVINPIDVSRIRTPGAELRDALVPVPMAFAAAELVPNLSMEGFYQFGWEKTEVDPVGTYFSTTDYVGAGGTHAFLTDFIDGLNSAINTENTARGLRLPTASDQGLNFDDPFLISPTDHPMATSFRDIINEKVNQAYTQFVANKPMVNVSCTDLTGLGQDCARTAADPNFLAIGRQSDREPADDGQYGIALRYLSPALNDTEFGFYFVNAHSRLPLVSGRIGDAKYLAHSIEIEKAVNELTAPLSQFAGPLALDRFAKASSYFVEYPEDLKTYGLSFNTLLGASGWALQGEYSLHPDLPLQRTERALFQQALRAAACELDVIRSSDSGIKAECDGLAKSTSRDPSAEYQPGLIVGDEALSGQFGLGGYLQGYRKRDVSQAQITATQVFGPALGSDALGFIAEAALMRVHGMPDRANDPLETGGSSKDGSAEATSWGYRGALWLDYSNAVGAASLSPYIQFQHDVDGSSPAPFGPFVEGRKAITLGVGASYLERWSANVSYTAHSGSNNPLAGRDFMSMSFSYSF